MYIYITMYSLVLALISLHVCIVEVGLGREGGPVHCTVSVHY